MSLVALDFPVDFLAGMSANSTAMSEKPQGKSRPVFRSQWIVKDSGSGYLVFSEDERYLLEGPLYDALIPLLDGQHRVSDIARQMEGNVDASEVRDALGWMLRERLLAESPGRAWTRADAFWELAGVPAVEAESRLAGASVSVMASDAAAGELICRALGSLGIRVTGDAAFRIVAVADYLDPALGKVNEEALSSGTPWMMAKPFGRSQWLGPLFVPGRTACWECLAARLRENEWSAAASVAALPTTMAATAAWIATEAAKWVMSNESALSGLIRVLDAATMEALSHFVVRYPQCAACSGSGTKVPRGLKPAPRGAGTKLAAVVSPITGIVSGLSKKFDAGGVYVYTGLMHGSVTVAGKGLSDEPARMSCISEAAERYSAQFRGDETRIRASFRELGDDAIDPRSLLLFSEEQYRGRSRWNARHHAFHYVPEPFREDLPVEWVAARPLRGKGRVYVPAAYCYLGYPASFCVSDTNGCAAGETFDRAVQRGLLELVERDAVALWWYNRVRRPGVPIEDYRLLGMVDHLRRQGRSVWALDITTDFGIPVLVAVSVRADGGGVLFGSAADFDREAAMVGAVCELAQCLSGGFRGVELERWMRPTGPGRPVRTRRPASLPEGFVLDLTRPQVGVPVARVIVPGLRHHWRRLAPGRLYDVPVKLGWVKRRRKESEINPVPYFL